MTGLAKAIQQAKGNLRAPTVIAEAIRVLRRPQGKAVSNGVLLLDVLDSVELVCSKSSKKQQWKGHEHRTISSSDALFTAAAA